MRAKRRLIALSLLASVGLPAFSHGSSVTAQMACNPAYLPDQYGNCVPDYGYGDVLNCADINWGVFQLVDVNNDPYNLDTLYGPGNGWTCDGVG
jgi:hypothetical protein